MRLNTNRHQLPDTIVGDLDSLHPSVRQHYEKLGVSIIEDPDQYSTDFTKCLKYLNIHIEEIMASPRKAWKSSTKQGSSAYAASTASTQREQASTLEIVILGGLGGRVDQAFSQIHHLHMMTQTQREVRETGQNKPSENEKQKSKPAAGGNLYLVSEESITFILQQGKNIIHTPATKRADRDAALRSETQPEEGEGSVERRAAEEQGQEYFFEENIGIIPVSGPASISTRGFEWDVQDWHTEIGGQISTSNHIRADTVEVETSVPVLFTLELAQRLKRA